eukprot:Opistho-2@36878
MKGGSAKPSALMAPNPRKSTGKDSSRNNASAAHEDGGHADQKYQTQFEMQRASRRISVLMNQITMQRAKSRDTASDIDSIPLGNYKEITFYNLPAISQTPNFQRCANTEEFDAFLLSALHYFKNFFKMKKLENELELEKESSGGITTHSAKARSYEAIKGEQESRLSNLAQRYAFLLLRIGRQKNQTKDRFLFETLYNFTTYIVWLAFGRLDWYATSNELGRLMRSDMFNLNARVSLGEPDMMRAGNNRSVTTPGGHGTGIVGRNSALGGAGRAVTPGNASSNTNTTANKEGTEGGADRSSSRTDGLASRDADGGEGETHRLATSGADRPGSQTPGGDMGSSRKGARSTMSSSAKKRPSVYATLNVRSPIIASLLPKPSESAAWLFDRRKPMQRPGAKKKAEAGRFVFAVNPDHFTDIGSTPILDNPSSGFSQLRDRRNSRRASVIIMEQPSETANNSASSDEDSDYEADKPSRSPSLSSVSREHVFRRMSTTLKISSRPTSPNHSRPASRSSSRPSSPHLLPKIVVPDSAAHS